MIIYCNYRKWKEERRNELKESLNKLTLKERGYLETLLEKLYPNLIKGCKVSPSSFSNSELVQMIRAKEKELWPLGKREDGLSDDEVWGLIKNFLPR